MGVHRDEYGLPFPDPYPLGQVPGQQPSEGTLYLIQIALTAGAGGVVTTLPAEPIGGYEFVWEELGGMWNLTAAAPPDGLWEIRINDTATQRFFSSGYISVNAILGSVEREPYKLRHPFTFPANSGIMIEARNNGVGGDTLTLTFIGKRIEIGQR